MKLVAVSNCDKGIIKDLNSVRIPRDERKNYLLCPPVHQLVESDIGDLLPKHCTKREQYPLCRYVYWLLNEVTLTSKFLLNVFERSYLGFGLFKVETASVVTIELGKGVAFCFTFLEELVVV